MEVLKSIFDCAIERGIILDNPAHILKRRKIQSKPIVHFKGIYVGSTANFQYQIIY